VAGALMALGGTVDKVETGVAGVVAGFALPNEKRGGVLGLGGGALPPGGLLDSISALSGEGGGIGKTAKRGLGDTGALGAGFWASGPSTSSRETGLLARGELRVGRVLGRPSPVLNCGGGGGVGVEVCTGDGELKGGSLEGVPGGVVLSSSGIVGNKPGSGESDGEGVT
jgi:hypothetical protein